MLEAGLKKALEKHVGSIVSVKAVGGGSINDALQLETADGHYFVKRNNASRFPGMFEAEMKGLRLLAAHSTFVIPNVIAQETEDDTAFLLMEYLEPGYTNWKSAGTTLAALHRQTADRFGLDHDNYIGSLTQRNTQHVTWPDFFANERILPQVQLALKADVLNHTDLLRAESFCKRVNELFPEEAPALLHGDLWIGNFLFTPKGPSIYDPAVYYGHREMDIAMTKLFGGFDGQFYRSYNEAFPLEKSWEERVRYCNLYPLLVHVNLFGGGYVREVRSVLSEF
jgi:fructosamine-3-kinase